MRKAHRATCHKARRNACARCRQKQRLRTPSPKLDELAQKHTAELEASSTEVARQQEAEQQLQEAARNHEHDVEQLRAELALLKQKSE